jgi:DNA-binding beta-propeller fold protein YncE
VKSAGWWVLGALLAAMLASGCAPRQQPIFDAPAQPLIWPAPPEAPRIRYVGQLTSAEDLKPRRGPFTALGELLVGRDEPRPFYGPRAAARTHDGRYLWVADPGGRCLHVLDLRDRGYRKITHAGDEPLLSPVDVSHGPEETMYVCDSEGVSIHQFGGASGALLRTLRLPEEISRPAAVAYVPETRELIVVDVAAHDLKVLDEHDRIVRIIGGRGLALGEFNYPSDILLDADGIWVVDTGNQRVQRLTLEGEPVSAFGRAGDAPGDLAMPKSIARDRNGHLYVIDARFENVQIFDAQGRLLLMFGDEGTGPGEFWLPAGIFIDHEDRIWVSDTYNARVQVFDYLGEENSP